MLKFAENNCCQSVFSAFANDFGMDESMAIKVASGFGGGMSRGETCGAVTGAYMTIGLKYGNSVTPSEAKVITKQKVQTFNDLFIKKHGSLLCKELLGVNISVPEGLEKAEERNLFELICPRFVATACKIIEKI